MMQYRIYYIEQLQTLQTLILSRAGVGADGAESLADAIQDNTVFLIIVCLSI
jgi:hypothetical protein